MNEEKLKIGTYTEDEIFNYMTEQEGGMLGRSMYDAIFDKIHAQITEIEQLKNENQQLKEKLEASEKSRKEDIEFINNINDWEICSKYDCMYKDDVLDVLRVLDIDKGE